MTSHEPTFRPAETDAWPSGDLATNFSTLSSKGPLMTNDTETYQPPKRGQLLTPKDVAYLLRVPVASARALLRDGLIKASKIGPHWRVTWEELDRFLASL